MMITPVNNDMFYAIWRTDLEPKRLEFFQKVTAGAKNYNNANAAINVETGQFNRGYDISDDPATLVTDNGLAVMDMTDAIIDEELETYLGL